MTRRPFARRALLLAALAPALVATPGAAAPPPPGSVRDYLDVRTQLRDQAPTPAPVVAVPPGATLELDPLSGTARSLQRLDGAMSAPSDAPPATVARDFARTHARALGLDATAVAGLRLDQELRSPSGLTVVRFRQQVDGIPTFDSGLRVAIDHAGRVLTAGGSPRDDLPSSAGSPQVSAAAALAAVMRSAGATAAPPAVSAGPAGPRETTTFATGDIARLVLFGARSVHLAWHVTYDAGPAAWYDAVVDAATGRVLYRANLVRSAVNARVFHNYPGAPAGGTQDVVDLSPYLSSTAITTGPNAHAYADLNDDDQAQPAEEVKPMGYTFQPDTSGDGGCDTEHLCAWDHLDPTSWQVNEDQSVVQAFWYANHFHDHLAAAPIGFDAASGAFEGTDPLQLEALDGANTEPGGGPDRQHVDNANMATPPDGLSPHMQMYLFSHASPLFRDADGADDAAIVYHEYTHGLSGRLVTGGDGSEALNAPQSAAMSEGLSDWYAMDELVREGLVADGATPGQVDMGRYVDAVPHTLRYEPMDCPVGASDPTACPGSPGAGPGGFTYGDFGRVDGAPEVHADGEIWGQTLWQLRSALVGRLGEATGSDTAERLITDALRLSIPEPSFLDLRNAILAADVNDTGGANHDLIWEVFRSRGMGFFAASTDSSDVAPAEDFTAPPAPGAPAGAVAGTVTSQNSGLPIAGATAGVGGLATSPAFAPFLGATTDASGAYAIGSVPAGTYPKLTISSPAGYDSTTVRATVSAGQTTPLDAQLRRDWAALGGGAQIAQTSDDSGAPYGCGAAALVDQSQGAGWSALNAVPTRPQTIVRLPQAITVEGLGMDPAATCGDGPGAATRGYLLEASSDGVSFSPIAQGQFAASASGHLNAVAPTGATSGVRYLRLTLVSAQSALSDYVDFSELTVYGNPPNVLPSGTLRASDATPSRGETVTLDASSFRDPDSAITGYRWDFDGDGTIDATTQEPTATFAYPASGSYTPVVAADDYRGGSGTASTSVTVSATGGPAKPVIRLPRTGSRGRVRVRVSCPSACRVSGTLTADRATRHRAHLRTATLGRLRAVTVTGTRTLTLRVGAAGARALRRHAMRRLRAGAHVAATVSGGPRTAAARRVRLRL